MKRTLAIRKRRRPDSGEALVEMALVLPILIVLSMGMLDFGRAFHAKSVLDQAAREGARVGVVTLPTFDPVPAQGRAAEVLAAAGMSSGSATASLDPNTKLVSVKIKYTFQFVTPGVFTLIGAKFGNTIDMNATSTMRYEDGT